jgi:hypothetical protein
MWRRYDGLRGTFVALGLQVPCLRIATVVSDAGGAVGDPGSPGRVFDGQGLASNAKAGLIFD